MEQEISGVIVMKYEPCFEDLVNILLNNNYEITIKKIDGELEIKYFMKRKF